MAQIDFIGEYEHRLDDRGRLAIPSTYRPFFEMGGYLLPGPDGQIELHTPESYGEMKTQRTAGNLLAPTGRRQRRGLFGRLHRIELDRQGRILIPAPLRKSRGLESNVVISGMGEYLEIWSDSAWARELE